MSSDYKGVPVSEAEVAADLGFANVYELRRWSTDLGMKVKELEHELSLEKCHSRNVRWQGERMMKIFCKAEEALLDLQKGALEPARIDHLLLAIRVVCNRAVDWNHDLKDWLEM